MKEEFLHYLFEQQLIDNTEFEIISPGIKNVDAGPDFFNAKIKIGETIWAGNVEIHIQSSDWNRHGHQNDKSYDNIILHLVLKHDVEIYSTSARLIPTYEIKFNQELFNIYDSLIQNKLWVHCENELYQIDAFTKLSYQQSLAIERLERKSKYFEDLLEYNKNDWGETFFQAIAKGIGGKLNQVPFELLAKSVSLKVLSKSRGNLLQIESIIYGQAGLLEDNLENDNYYSDLQKEYKYQKKKNSLTSVRPELWKFSKIRPYNFPTIKIALLAKLINKYQSLLSIIIKCGNIDELEEIFDIEASEYWETHYLFGKESKKLTKKIGKASKHHLIINTIIPFLYVYADKTGKENLKEKSLDWLTKLPDEDNSITRNWEQRGFENTNALQSQALIELKNERCDKHRCLDCRIAHKILTLTWKKES
jgi:hypothetical protein